MPTSIPFHPSLALCNVVPMATLKKLEEISALQAPIDAAQDQLNAALMTKRSLDMSTSEIADMSIETASLTGASVSAQQFVLSAATKLTNLRVSNFSKINDAKAALGAVTDSIESPVDYNKTMIKTMPISADSLKMDAQYFSFDEEDQAATNTMKSIKGFVSASTSILGDKYSAETHGAVNSQINSQRENHNIEGTLIITLTCTHKDAKLLAPFVLDVDKGIRVWNEYFSVGTTANPVAHTGDGPPPAGDYINPNDAGSMAKIAQEQDSPKAQVMNILSGATYGSSFVGMVHVLKAEGTSSTQTMRSVASSLQGQMEVGSWFADAKGGFGVESTFADDAKKLLSTQNIQSHVSLVVMGVIPSIKSNAVEIGVKQFAKFDPDAMMGKLATLATDTQSSQESVSESAAAARTGGKMIELRGAEISSVMSSLNKVDDGANQMLDINSMMISMEDYIGKAIDGDIGVPLTYYLKPITASQLAQMWVAKYLPGDYITSKGDDT